MGTVGGELPPNNKLPASQEMAAQPFVFCLLLLFTALVKSSSINRLRAGDEMRAKRRPEMDTNGFYGDTFSSGFGDFYTAKRNGGGYGQGGNMDELSYMKRQALIKPRLAKRRPEMDTNGFYGDTFSSGFGDFYTAKRGLPLPRDRQLV